MPKKKILFKTKTWSSFQQLTAQINVTFANLHEEPFSTQIDVKVSLNGGF